MTSSSAQSLSVAIPGGQTVNLNLANMTQLASPFAVTTATVNGNAPAQWQGVTIGPDCTMSYTYSNGQIAPAFQIPIGNVNTTTGLAGEIQVSPIADPNQGGNPLLLRDGGISGNPNYVYNTSGDASYQGRLSQLLSSLSTPTTFTAAGDITTQATLDGYATASVSWLEAQRANAASQSSYNSALLSAASTALSNATGVNLDTEMSKMLDLENSYSATAKLLSTVDGIFGTFLSDLGNQPA